MKLKRILRSLTPPVVSRASQDLSKALRRPSVRKRLVDKRGLHLGCGKNVIPGWANVDFDETGEVIGWDLRDPLPTTENSTDLIYSEHFFEHVTQKQAKALLETCQRALRAGGTIRLSVPCLKALVEAYESANLTEWEEFGWLPESPCKLMNEGMRLWGHTFLYDFDELRALLEEVGFRDVQRVEWHQSAEPDLCNLECRSFHGDLIVEAKK